MTPETIIVRNSPSSNSGEAGFQRQLFPDENIREKLALQFQLSYVTLPKKNARKPIIWSQLEEDKHRVHTAFASRRTVLDNTVEALIAGPTSNGRVWAMDEEETYHLPR